MREHRVKDESKSLTYANISLQRQAYDWHDCIEIESKCKQWHCDCNKTSSKSTIMSMNYIHLIDHSGTKGNHTSKALGLNPDVAEFLGKRFRCMREHRVKDECKSLTYANISLQRQAYDWQDCIEIESKCKQWHCNCNKTSSKSTIMSMNYIHLIDHDGTKGNHTSKQLFMPYNKLRRVISAIY